MAVALAGDRVADTTAGALLLLVGGVGVAEVEVAALVVGESEGVVVVQVDLAVAVGERALGQGDAAVEGGLEEDIEAGEDLGGAGHVIQGPCSALGHGGGDSGLRLEDNILLELPGEGAVLAGVSGNGHNLDVDGHVAPLLEEEGRAGGRVEDHPQLLLGHALLGGDKRDRANAGNRR